MPVSGVVEIFNCAIDWMAFDWYLEIPAADVNPLIQRPVSSLFLLVLARQTFLRSAVQDFNGLRRMCFNQMP